MSELLTLQELRECILPVLPGQCNVSPEEFTQLVNRVTERLFQKSAQHGNIGEFDVTPVDNVICISTLEFSHAMAFKINCKPYRIEPVAETYKGNGTASNSFIDLGYNKDNRMERKYRIPECLHDQDLTDYEFKMLAKCKIPKVNDDSDLVAVKSKSAIKNGIIAILHEDAIDPDTANKYWEITQRELNESDQEFRGPVVPTISFHDPCITDATNNIV